MRDDLSAYFHSLNSGPHKGFKNTAPFIRGQWVIHLIIIEMSEYLCLPRHCCSTVQLTQAFQGSLHLKTHQFFYVNTDRTFWKGLKYCLLSAGSNTPSSVTLVNTLNSGAKLCSVYWVNLSKREGVDGVFQGLAWLLQATSESSN